MAIDKVYGAELEIKVDKAKNKLNEVSNVAQSLGKKLQELNRFDVVGGQAINIFSNKINTAGSKAKLLGNSFKLVRPAVEQASNEVKKLNNNIKQTGNSSKVIGNQISNAFNKGLKSVKRLTLGFLGARTAFSLFRKYMSEYSSENEVFAQKMQLTTSVIANALAPAFEFFGNVIQYVVIGLARVVELLFGVNILGRTVDNSLKGASKSAKELNDNLSGLDEISNIDKDASGLSTGIESQLEALNDFQKKIAEVEAWFKKYKIDEKILKIRDAIKAVWDWANEHPILTTAFIAGLIALKTNIIPSLVSLLSGSESTSLLSGFKTLLAVGLTVWVIDQMNALNDLENKVEEIEKRLRNTASEEETKSNEKTSYMKDFNDYNEQDYKKAKKGYEDAIKELEKAIKEEEKLVDAWTWIATPAKYYNAKDRIAENNKRIARLKEEIQKLNVTYDIGADSIGKSVELTDTLQKNLEKANNKAKFVNDNTFEWQGNIQNANNKANNLVGTLSTGFNNLDYSIKNSNNNFNNLSSDINNTFDKNYRLNIKTEDKDIDNTKNKINSLTKKTYTMKFSADTSAVLGSVSNAIGNIKTAFKKIGLNVPSYDVGTDYVPRDQIAMIHEGERIVPKKYNNSQYMGNDETNSLLIELNKNVLELANKPSILNVNGKELAKATYSDYQEEGSRRGSNMSIRRV